MTKSRKAKSKNKDFQKVKLKIGKKLPKGQNETIAAFKSTSIQIKEQLRKKDESQPVSKKKLNIKELLVQCLHYSSSVRSDAVQGILQLSKTSSTVLENNLSAILERTSSMILDKEYKVRQKAIQVIKYIFSLLSQSQISPFFPLISAYITCAMTHLGEPIQEDSLDVVDLCLDAYPELMNASATKLLPCFVKQIATPSENAGGQYTLVTNPSSKKSSQSWRLKVLRRLRRVLHSLLLEKSNSNEDEADKCVTVDWKLKSSVQLRCSNLYTANMTTTKSHMNQSTCSKDRDAMTVFITEITPLLSECWFESRPSNFTRGGSLGLESLNLVDNILAIYQLFRNFAKDDNLFEKEIAQYFLPYFPFSLQRRKADNKSKQTHISPDVINLRMCDLLSGPSKGPDTEAPEWLLTVVMYLQRSLASKNQQKTSVHSVVETLLTKWPEQSQSLLEKALDCFIVCDDMEEMKAWMHFFTGIAFSTSVKLFEPSQNIVKLWILALPKVLLKVEQESKQLITLILIAINQAVKRGVSEIKPKVKEVMSELLQSGFWGPERKVGTTNLLCLLLVNPELTRQDLSKLQAILLANPDLCVTFLEQLSWRESERGQMEVYLGFLFALLRCEKEHCHFDAAVSQQDSLDQIQKQVGWNLVALNKNVEQLKEIHLEYHGML